MRMTQFPTVFNLTNLNGLNGLLYFYTRTYINPRLKSGRLTRRLFALHRASGSTTATRCGWRGSPGPARPTPWNAKLKACRS